jgi:peptide/nickel transport system substrate-binding protein
MRRLKGMAGQLLLISLVVLAACSTPQSTPNRSSSGSTSGGQSDQPRATSGAKVLTWAIQQEPTDVLALSGLGGTRGPSAAFRQVAHAQLVKDDYRIAPYAELATELPSVEKGTWKLNADGTMETTWKLRPNIKWHDGVPFTASDLVFWLTVLKDDSMPSTSLLGLDQISSVSAPDPQTFVLHWSTPHYRANRIPEFGPIPKHILESVYAQKDPEALLTHRYFTSEFVGLGAFKLASWDPGSRIELVRFDDYFQGRPALDRVILQFIPDFNTMISNAMAGTIDVANPPADNMDVAMDLQRRWEGTGNRVRTDPGDRIRLIYMQYRADYARPANTVTNRTVRQAMYHAIDRPAMAQVITEGLSPVADSWFAPSNPLRKDIESAIPQYPFDVARSQQLLTQAGWTRGSDGVLVNQSTGDRFQLDVRNRPGSATERELVVLADYWKAIGIASTVTPPAPNLVSDREWLATYPGVQVSRLEAEDAFNTRRTHTRAVAGPANRWAGRNGAGYSNPTVDAIQDKLIVTVDPREQVNLHRQLVQEMLGEAALMPLYWDVELSLATKGVKGDVTAVETGYNIHTWDKE